MAIKRWLLLIAFTLPLPLSGQVEDALEQWLQDEGSEASAADQVDRLSELAASPVNINDTHALSQIPFISPFQAQALKNYIFLYGELLSLKELAFVPGFDSTTIALISPFLIAEPFTDNSNWNLRQGRHTLTTGLGATVEQAEGYRNGHYPGDNLHALFCYNYRLHDKIQLRLSADKDATEPWGRDNFYNYHLMLAELGRLERIIVGRYSLQFGQGLTLWTGLQPFDITGQPPARFGTGIRPAGTFYEENYLEGLAATVRVWDGIHLTGFASRHDGETLAGGRAEWHHQNLIAGITASHSTLRDSIIPNSYAYSANAFSGNALTNIGLDAAWQYR